MRPSLPLALLAAAAATGALAQSDDGPDIAALLAGGDPAYGEYLYGECTSCHGSGRAGIPAIEGYDAESVVVLLNAYKSGEIDHEAMRVVASGLGDAEVASLALFIATLEPRD